MLLRALGCTPPVLLHVYRVHRLVWPAWHTALECKSYLSTEEIQQAGYLVSLHIAIYTAHKCAGSEVTQRPAHYSQAHTKHGGVAKVKGRLEEARHLRLDEEVMDAVDEHIPAVTQIPY